MLPTSDRIAVWMYYVTAGILVTPEVEGGLEGRRPEG